MFHYYMKHENGYEPTKERPSARELGEMRAEIRRERKQARKHAPGMGWHYVPGDVEICFNGANWFASLPSSEGAILAHAEDLCKLRGLDFARIYTEAYPKEDFRPVTPYNREACERPATLEDARAVIDDLDDVNYHQLANALEEALGLDNQG